MDVTLTQLQPGVEDGGTPTEVVAGVELKKKKRRKKRTLMLHRLFMNNTSEGRVKLEKKTRKSKKKGENRKQKIPKKGGP